MATTDDYVEEIKKAKENGKQIKVTEFMERCKKDGVEFPKVLRITASKGIWGVFR